VLLSVVLALLGIVLLVTLSVHWWSSHHVSARLVSDLVVPSGEEALALADPDALPRSATWLGLALLLVLVAAMGIKALRSYHFAVNFARRTSAVSDFNQARLLDFIELSSDWLWETDAQHRFTLVSSGIRSIANMDAEAFIGKEPWSLAGDETRADAWRDVRHKLSLQQPFTVLVTRRDLANTPRHLEFTGKPMFDERGFVGYRGIGHDLTQQIEAVDELRSSELRFRTLVETFFDWYWEQDAQLRFTQLLTSPFNPLSPDNIPCVGRTSWELAGADPASPEWQAHIEQLRAHQPFDNFIYPIQVGPGRTVWFSVTGRPVFDDAGRFAGYRGVSRDVTREHETRKALEASEARYRTTFEQAPVGILSCGPDGRLLSANQAFARLVGRSADELMGTALSELAHPDERARDAAMMTALRDGQVDSFSREKRYVHASGRSLWASVSISALRDDAGVLRAAIAVVQDITARIDAQRERHAVEERYRRLVDVSPDGIIVHRARRIVFANRAAVEIFGARSSDALLGQGLDHFCSDAQALSDADATMAAPGTTLAARHLRIHRADGRDAEVEVTSVVIGFDDGPAMLSLVRDITARIAAENALQQSRARYQEVVESVNEVIFQSATDGRFLFLNKAWEHTTGHTISDALGRRLQEFLHPDDRSGARLHFERVLDGDESANLFEVRLRTREGELRWLEGHARPMHDPEGRLLGLMGSLDDITERKIAEMTLKNLNKELEARVRARTAELEASNRELEAFSYSVSHDLRAPLRAIDGFSVILQEDLDGALDGTARTYLQRIRTATARMAQLIDDLIELARLTRQPLRRQNIDLSQLASQIVDELRAAHPGRRVEADITPGLTANADPVLMRVALDNLLRNAFKFTVRREVARIAFFATRDEHGVQFCVEDNGVGFDMAYASKLFVPFHRLHASSEFLGSGIGLATVARIVQRHGGRISAHAAPDEGARFCFSIGH
jgi:PAS domain S-box-containing protein